MSLDTLAALTFIDITVFFALILLAIYLIPAACQVWQLRRLRRRERRRQ